MPKHAHINSFSPVFIDALYEDKGGLCDTNNPATPAGTTQWAIQYPGKSGGMNCGSNNGKEVSRVSGIVLPCGALPSSICDPSSNPPFPDLLGITRVRLSK
jgi:hypothetical protein